MSTSPYSNDLRKKAINYLNQGKSQKEVSEVFGIHRNTLHRWCARYRKEGSYTARRRLGRRRKLSYSEVELFVQDNPDTKLSNIGSKFAISAWHACRILKKIGFSYKKSDHLSGGESRQTRRVPEWYKRYTYLKLAINNFSYFFLSQ